MHLITGGSGSGKSAYAEQEIIRYSKMQYREYAGDGIFPFLYVATMMPRGREAAERIRRHQEQRMDAGFLTLERYTDLAGLIVPDNAGILLECVSNLTANELYERNRDFDGAYEAVISGVRMLLKKTEHLIVVTNEVYSDINGYSRETEEYRRLLGKINCRLARLANRVTEVVYGAPVCIFSDV